MTVTVDDGNGGSATADVVITVDPDPVTEVHIAFSPVSQGGNGTEIDAHGLLGDSDYTFTATDQNGNDITSEVTFAFTNDDGSSFPQGFFPTPDVFHTNIVGSGTFNITGTYRIGQPDEVISDPEFVGEEAHFTIVFVLP